MTERPDPPDPELVAVLREVAADPRSILLRVPRANALRAFQEHTPVRHTATGLTTAERHLLQCHRHELAHLLREACITKLSTESRYKDRFLPYRTARTGERVLSRSDWTKWAREVMIPADADGPEEALTLIRHCVSNSIQEANLQQLAHAWMRLLPTHGPQAILVLDLANRNQLRAANHLLDGIINSACGRADLAAAWANAGHVRDRNGDSSTAMECFDSALRFEPELISARFNRFIVGLSSNILISVEEDAAFLDDLGTQHREEIRSRCSALRNLKANGDLVPRLSSRAFDLRVRMGSSSGSLFDELS